MLGVFSTLQKIMILLIFFQMWRFHKLCINLFLFLCLLSFLWAETVATKRMVKPVKLCVFISLYLVCICTDVSSKLHFWCMQFGFGYTHTLVLHLCMLLQGEKIKQFLIWQWQGSLEGSAYGKGMLAWLHQWWNSFIATLTWTQQTVTKK